MNLFRANCYGTDARASAAWNACQGLSAGGCSERPSCATPERGFTMVEIALCLAVIGFALLAVVAVLPLGLQVQRENREETIIHQDATIWLDALRSGARGYDELTNYVEEIIITSTTFPAGAQVQTRYTPADTSGLGLTNGYRIIGLLSTPKYEYADVARQLLARSNHVVAHVRALSGAATEKFPQDNPSVRDLAFRYRLISEIVPYVGWDPAGIDSGQSGLPPEERAARSNAWGIARNLHGNLRDVRLVFRWPLLPGGTNGDGRQVFRTLIGGALTNEVAGRTPAYFFSEPRRYVRAHLP